MKKKILLVFFLMMVVFIPSNQLEKQKEEIILVSEVKKEKVFEPTVFLNGGEFSGEIAEDTLLHKGNYTVSKNLVIKEGVTVEVEAGSKIIYSKSDVDFIINGTFKVMGTEEEIININYDIGRDVTKGTFIVINAQGRFEAKYSNIINVSTVYSTMNELTAINNNGTLILDNVQMSATKSNTHGNIVNSGTINVINSQFSKGVYLNEESNIERFENNRITNTFSIALEACNIDTFKKVKNNYQIDSNGNRKLNQIIFTGKMKQSIKLYEDSDYKLSYSKFTIPSNMELIMEAGTHLRLGWNIDFRVEGMLRLLGTEEKKVDLDYGMGNDSVSQITYFTIAPSGLMEARYSNINNIAKVLSTTTNLTLIDNKGTLIFDNVKTSLMEVNTAGDIVSSGNVSITNSKLSKRLILNNGSQDVIIKNNLVNRGIYVDGTINGELNIIENQASAVDAYPVRVSLEYANENTFSNIKDNHNLNSERCDAIGLIGNPKQNVKLANQVYVIINNLIIPENVIFEVFEGAIIKFGHQRRITVNGLINFVGTKLNPIFLTSNETSHYNYLGYGIVINGHGRMIANNIEMKSIGGHDITVYGQLQIINSIIRDGILYDTINFNQLLKNNFLYGSVKSNIPIDASFNYWGSETGPRRYNLDTNSYNGSGTPISNNISFYPYNTIFERNNIKSAELIKFISYDLSHFGKKGVNSFTGNYSNQYIEFELSNSLNITRIYNSKNSRESILGYGWALSYDSYIEKYPYSDGSYIVHLPDSSINIFMKQEDYYVSLNSRNEFQIVNEKYILTTKDQTIYTYSKNGKLESITDKYGNQTVLTYTDNLLTSITDSNHRTYTLEYQNNLLTQITDPINRTTVYSYKDGLLFKVTNTNGIETIYSYNDAKQLINIRENSNIILTLEYITEGVYKDYILKLTNEKGLIKTYTYDSSSNMTTETDSNNRITKKYYDRDGYVYKEINPSGNTKTTIYQLENSINKYGEVASVTDINSAKTTYTRDNKGNITKVTNPDSSTKQYTYNSKNQVIKEIDEVGSITEYIYDTDEVTLLKQVKPINGTTLYNEEADQNLFQIISYTYYKPSEVNNIKGLIKTKTDDKGTTIYTYNNNGDIISSVNANNIEIVYTKNALGWTLTEQVEDDYVTEYEYDKQGNVTSIKKDSKLISKTEYNYQNKPIKVMDGNCKEIALIKKVTKALSWDSNQNLVSLNDNSTICDAITYEYDISGNKTKETDREGNITTYQYDQYGNVIRKNLPNDSSYIYEYDNVNRLVKTSFEEGEKTTLLEEKSYTVASTSTVTTKTYTSDTDFKTMVESYNNRGFKTVEKLEANSAITNYYKNGQISSTVDKNGSYTYYYYDKVNRLNKKCVQVNSYYVCTLYTYDNFGRLIEEKVGKNTVVSNGTPSSYVVTTYQYDNLGQVIKKTTSSGEEIEYTYDVYGNVLTQKTKIAEDKYQTKTNEYNYLNKVTKENLEGIITTYEYDGVGNLIKKTTGENVVTEYQYNKNYQVIKTMLDKVVQETNIYDNMGNVIEKTDPKGNITKYNYDKRNNVVKEINSKNNITTYSYDYNNRKIEMNESNKITTYSYDKFDNVISKTINGTITYQYTYDKNNNLLKEIDPLGNSVTHFYDKLNRVIQVTDKLGNYKIYSYDTLSNVITERNEKSIYTYYVYDERGNVKEKKVDSLVIEQNEYDLMNNLVKKKDANNNVTIYEYNTLNQLVKKTNPLGYIEEYEYDKNGNVIKLKTSDKVILYSYDNRGNLLKTVEQTEEGKQKIETSKMYDNNNNVIREVDGNGNVIIHTYDSLNNLIKTKNPLNQVTVYEYDSHNNLVKETDYLGDSKVYVYDSFDRVIEKKNELNEVVEKLEYDLMSRQIKSIDGLGHTTTFVYDKLDRVIEKIDPLNRSEKTTYDALGNALTKTDFNGNITKYEYNKFNKVTKVINALNEATFYSYDNNNNLLTVVDGNGRKTIYTYNALNLELTEKDSLGNIETKEYNGNGTLKKKTTKNGLEILYSYDIHDRLITENDIVYTYDDNNNLLEVKENENVITRTYDSLNRVTKKIENGFTTTFTYSDYTETSIDPKGNETVKKFDKTGRLKEVEGNVSYIYNLDGTVNKVIYQNGSMETYTYKGDKSLDTLVNTYGEDKEIYQYQYDNNKNIISKYENGKETSYTYDVLNRIKTISEVTYHEIGNEELEKVETLLTTYTYDKAGNRTKEVSGVVTKEYTYDNNNRLVKVIEKENDVVTKTTIYTYDNNGNELTETVNNELKVTNTYNERNELVKTVTDKEINYTYNPEGKRIQKQVENKVTKYIYERLDVILEIDENDNKIAQNIYGLALVTRNTDKKGYYLYNGHGDTVSIVDNEENLLNNYTYDEWGVIIDSNGEFDNPYRYAGYYYDTETDNYYLLSRYYNPEIARFISEDSYRGDYKDPLSLNRYVYVVNNPLIYIDPDGYWPKWLEDTGDWIWKRIVGIGDAAKDFVYDTTVGALDFVGNVSGFVISEAGKFTNDMAYKMGMITDDNYANAQNMYGNLNHITSSNLLEMPDKIITGIQSNFKETFNYDNFVNYLTTDNYSEIKSYTKSVIQTGTTIYGGYKFAKGVNSLASSISNVSITMTPVQVGTIVNPNGALSGVVVPTITGVNVAALNQAIINGGIGTAAISTNGNNSKQEEFDDDYFNPNKQPKNPKLVDSKYLKKHGIDPHKFKTDILGSKTKIKYFDIYVDKDGSIWTLRKGTSNYIPTYENINYYK